MQYGDNAYHAERCRRLERALWDACGHIHVMRGGMGTEANFEYQYFIKAHKVDEIIESGNNRYFEVGQLIATTIPVKDKNYEETPDRYVGEVLRVEKGEEYVVVMFDKATQQLARKNHKMVLDTPWAVRIKREKIWGAEELYVVKTYNGDAVVKVVQFQVPDIAIIRYDSGELLRVNINHLKSARK